MDSSPQMLLNVWREVSRHILIDESVTRVMPLLSPELPLDALLVRYVDLARSSLETVAAAMVRPDSRDWRGENASALRKILTGSWRGAARVIWCEPEIGRFRSSCRAFCRPILPVISWCRR